MTRFLMLVAVAAVAGAMYVAAAPGSQQALGPTARQFAALKKEVASLNKSLKALKKDEGKVKSLATDADGFIAGCFLSAGVVPTTQFGDPSGGYGFAYAPSTGTQPTTLRTALDIDASATPQGFLQAVNSSCVSSGAGTTAHAQTHSSSGHLLVRGEHGR